MTSHATELVFSETLLKEHLHVKIWPSGSMLLRQIHKANPSDFISFCVFVREKMKFWKSLPGLTQNFRLHYISYTRMSNRYHFGRSAFNKLYLIYKHPHMEETAV